MVVSEELIQEIYRIIADKSLVLGIDEAVPLLSWKASKDVVILSIQLYIIPIKVFEKVISTKHLCNFDKLVGIAVAVEERLFSEDHGCKHRAQRPHI